MTRKHYFTFTVFLLALAITSCKDADKKTGTETVVKEPKLKEEMVSYTGDSVTMNSFIVYDENKEGVRPAILVIPEWWGLNDYIKGRARQLAELGYIAMAVDIYGNSKTADNPDSALYYALPFYKDPQMTKERFDASVAKLKSYAQADTGQLAAIGYCFGGAQVLNMARLGEDLKGVVSFHGNLVGVPPHKQLLKADVLVCHGAADPFVPPSEVDQFKREMDSIGARYTFKAYDGALHAFTNPNATAVGKKFNMQIAYNEAADSASWNDMKAFFNNIFK